MGETGEEEEEEEGDKEEEDSNENEGEEEAEEAKAEVPEEKEEEKEDEKEGTAEKRRGTKLSMGSVEPEGHEVLEFCIKVPQISPTLDTPHVDVNYWLEIRADPDG